MGSATLNRKFSSIEGRRMLLDALEAAKKAESAALMERRQTGANLRPEIDSRLSQAISERMRLEEQVRNMPTSVAPDIVKRDAAKIGLAVSYRYVKDGAERSLFLSGYNEDFPDAEPPFIRYNSLIGKAIIGAEIGAVVTLPDGDVEITALEYLETHRGRMAAKAA